MILEYDGNSVDIGEALDPLGRETEVVQATMRTASGIKQTDSYEVVLNRYTYKFQAMTDDEYESLFYFFIENAVAEANQFTITDDLGDQRLVTFTSSELKFSREGAGADNSGMWAGSFTVEEVSEIGSTPGGGG